MDCSFVWPIFEYQSCGARSGFYFSALQRVGVYRDYKFRNKINYFKNYSQLRPPKKQAAAT
jgi:hypothetical protein